jgi:hypothetical protein
MLMHIRNKFSFVIVINMKKILLILLLLVSGFGWGQLTHQGCLDAGMVVFGQYSNGGASGVCVWVDDNGNLVCSWGNSGNAGLNACINNCPNATYYFGSGNAGRDYCQNVIIPMPISLIELNVISDNNDNFVIWVTTSEENNDYYLVEHSEDGINWGKIVMLPGAGNSTQTLTYRFIHVDPPKKINYYKLTQVDYNGNYTIYGPISIDNRENKRTLIKTINTLGQEVTEGYSGLVINLYDDGTTEKIYK